MFEITGDHVSLLNDEDLRTLVALLCEAEVRRAGFSPLGVTWGGNQNASDGGLDVRASLQGQVGPQLNLPRSLTGFQVKAQDMPRAAILAEMKPKGTVRSVIRELAETSGAYIIVSSKGSVSDTALRARRSAMAEAVRELPIVSSLYLDFYDRNRVATWVREHVGLCFWLREKIGRAVPGWRPYGPWATTSESQNAEYLLDEALRVSGRDEQGKSFSALEGIQHIRVSLTREQEVVRLIGLSGVGKTRLAQALFDERLGQGALDPSFAAYTNLSDGPNPQPVAMASDLLAQGMRAILIVDNCGQELHRQLSEVCKASESHLSLLTIEFDIQDDLPEGTDVFDLQPSSDSLIEKILEHHFPTLSQVNAQSVARFAGGNARVAIALAGTIKSGESVAQLRNAVLFDRLFHQRNDPSDSLMQTAQACSLVYSFQGADDSRAEEAELWRLADVIGRDIRSVYSDLSELRRRDLLQSRGVWRALLPHAVANKLAALALESIPPAALEQFWGSAPARLLKSFSRRLGYLHTSAEARSIVEQWLSMDGLLGKLGSLNDLEISMLCNVAPVAPGVTLDAIQRAIQEMAANGTLLKGEEFRTLLLSLAYDPDLFDRAVALLFDLIEDEQPSPYSNHVKKSFPSLFQIYLSGTHATIEQRLAVIESLLGSESKQRREFGIAALNAALTTGDITSHQRFDFGAWPRDYGFNPRTRDEIVHWFRSALSLCKRLLANETIAPQVRKTVADNLRGLWNHVEMYDEVEEICKVFSTGHFWPEGWKAIHSIRRWRQEPLDADQERRLIALEELFAPRNLVDRTRAVVLQNARGAFDDLGPHDDVITHMDRMQTQAYELGQDVAQNEAAFKELLPELVTAESGMYVGHFVKGMIDNSSDHRGQWNSILAQFVEADPKRRSAECLAIFLFNLRNTNSELVEVLLDESMNDPSLAEWVPLLQCRAGMQLRGVERLKRSLARGIAPIERYHSLVYTWDTLSGEGLAELSSLISELPGGFDVALEILWMRIALYERDKVPVPREILVAGRSLLGRFDFAERNDNQTYHLNELVKHCLTGPDGSPVAYEMCQRVRESLARRHFADSETTSVLGILLAVQPTVTLNTLFPLGTAPDDHIYRIRYQTFGRGGLAFDNVPEQILIEWCEQDRDIRYPLMASAIFPFKLEPNTEIRHWTKVALKLLEQAPDRIKVLMRYIERFQPMGWSGSQVPPWEANVKLLDSLADFPDPNIVAFAGTEKARLLAVLDLVRQREASQERRENERFE
jgi:hypothetical protein